MTISHRFLSAGMRNAHFTFIGGEYPLVRDISSDWVESRYYRDFLWTSDCSWEDSSLDWRGNNPGNWNELGFGFMWSDIELATSESAVVSMIIRAGDFISTRPVLEINKDEISPEVQISREFQITGSVTNPNNYWPVRLFLAVDNNVFDIVNIANCSVAGSFTASFLFEECSLKWTSHEIACYAVDGFGCVSDPVTFPVSLIPCPTPTFSVSSAPELSSELVLSQ